MLARVEKSDVMDRAPRGTVAASDGLAGLGIHRRIRRNLRRVTRPITRPLREIAGKVESGIKQFGREVADPIEDIAERVEQQAQRTLDLAQEVSERALDAAKDLVGANGLSFRDLADQMDLATGVTQVTDATNPWIAKLERQILAAQAALAELERVTAAGGLGQVPSDIPPASEFAAGGVLQTPAAQLVIQGVSFAGPIGRIVSVGLSIVSSIGAMFGREKTRDRFIQIRTRLDNVFEVHGERVNRAVDILAMLGDADARAVKGEKVRQAETAKPAAKTRRRVAVAAGAAAAAGAGFLLLRSFLGRFRFPGAAQFRRLVEATQTEIEAQAVSQPDATPPLVGTVAETVTVEPPPPVPVPRGAPADTAGTPGPDLRVPGALDPANNLGLIEISNLVNNSNSLHAKTVELIELLDRLGIDVGAARPGVSGMRGPLDVGGRALAGVALALAGAWIITRLAKGASDG